MTGCGSSRGHEQAQCKEIVTARPKRLIGSSVSAFQRLPVLHAPESTNVDQNCTLPNRLGGAGFVAEDSRLAVLDLTIGLGKPGGRPALMQPQVPNGAQHWCSTLLGEHEEGVDMVIQLQTEVEESDALLDHHLAITRKRRNEQLQAVLNKTCNGKDTMTRFFQEREGFPNVVHDCQKEMILLTQKHDKIVSEMQHAHEELEALLTQKHDKIVSIMQHAHEERKNKMLRKQKNLNNEILKHKILYYWTYYSYKGAIKEKTITEKKHAEAKREMNAQLELFESQLAAAKQAVTEKDSELLALQSQLAERQEDKVKLQEAVAELSDRQKSQIKSKSNKVAIELLWEVAHSIFTFPGDMRSVNFASGYETLMSIREENDVNKMMSCVHAALNKAAKNWQTAQDEVEKLKLSCQEHLQVDTTMGHTEPSSETKAPPRDIPHDTVIECNADDSENERMEEQPQKKRKRRLASLTKLIKERQSSSPTSSQQTQLPRKNMGPQSI